MGEDDNKLNGKLALLKLEQFQIPIGEFVDREYSGNKLGEVVELAGTDSSEYPVFNSFAIEALKNAVIKKREADFWLQEAELIVWINNPELDLEEAKAKEFADKAVKK